MIGENLSIRPATQTDVEALLTWWNDGAVMAHAGFPQGLHLSANQVEATVDAFQNAIDCDGSRRAMLYILEVDGLAVGEMNYRRLKEDLTTFEIGIKICNSNYQGGGRGTCYLMMLLGELFIYQNAARVVLDTKKDNLRAQKVYEKIGFSRVAVQQEAIEYALSLENWLNLHPLSVTKDQIKHFLMQHHAMTKHRPYVGKSGLMAYLDKVGCIQFDPIDMCGKSPELTVHAHIDGIDKAQYYEMLYKDRVLLDYFDKNLCVLPLGNWPALHPERQRYLELSGIRSGEQTKSQEAERHVLEWIHRHGATSSKDLSLDEKVDWYWGPTRLSRATLERLYFEGKLIIHHKNGTNKYYALAEDYIPKALRLAPSPFSDMADYHNYMVHRRIRAIGMLRNKQSDGFLGIIGFKASHRSATFKALHASQKIIPLAVEGISEVCYIATEDWPSLKAVLLQTPAQSDRLYFIAPLDAMIWDRKLIAQLWDFNYKWEIYTPKSERQFGYYVLPMVYQGNFIGRIELDYHKGTKKVEVLNRWLEPWFSEKIKSKSFKKQFENALNLAIKALEHFHG